MRHMTPAVTLGKQLQRSLPLPTFIKNQNTANIKVIQARLPYMCLQTQKYSETHRSGGHFDVEINQQTSQPAQWHYKAAFQDVTITQLTNACVITAEPYIKT